MRSKRLVFGMLFIPLSFGILPMEDTTMQLPDDKAAMVQSVSSGIYRQFLAEHKALTTAENPEVETVNRVSNRVITAIKNYYASRKADRELNGFNWEIHLFEQTKVDAWCLPGGKMAVYAPLIPVTQSDAALAVVLTHEIAHVMLKHGDTRMKRCLKDFLNKKDLPTALSAKPRETKDFFRMAYGNGDYVGVILGFDQADEMAADELGAIFCAMAGYNPVEAIVFWERMSKLNGTGRQPELLSTHPLNEKRLSRMKELMDGIAQGYYKQFSKK